MPKESPQNVELTPVRRSSLVALMATPNRYRSINFDEPEDSPENAAPALPHCGHRTLKGVTRAVRHALGWSVVGLKALACSFGVISMEMLVQNLTTNIASAVGHPIAQPDAGTCPDFNNPEYRALYWLSLASLSFGSVAFLSDLLVTSFGQSIDTFMLITGSLEQIENFMGDWRTYLTKNLGVKIPLLVLMGLPIWATAEAARSGPAHFSESINCLTGADIDLDHMALVVPMMIVNSTIFTIFYGRRLLPAVDKLVDKARHPSIAWQDSSYSHNKKCLFVVVLLFTLFACATFGTSNAFSVQTSLTNTYDIDPSSWKVDALMGVDLLACFILFSIVQVGPMLRHFSGHRERAHTEAPSELTGWRLTVENVFANLVVRANNVFSAARAIPNCQSLIHQFVDCNYFYSLPLGLFAMFISYFATQSLQGHSASKGLHKLLTGEKINPHAAAPYDGLGDGALDEYSEDSSSECATAFNSRARFDSNSSSLSDLAMPFFAQEIGSASPTRLPESSVTASAKSAVEAV